MKALSIHPEYAAEILEGVKTEEYRTWSTNYRGDLLICSTAKKTPGCISGHAICIVELTDIEQLEDGTYAWQLTNIRWIKPFPVRGQQRLYTVDDRRIIEPSPEEVIIKNGKCHPTKEFWQTYYQDLQD